MKKPLLLLVILLCAFFVTNLCAQEYGPQYAVDKGSFMVAGSAGFASFGGDAYGGGDRVTVISFRPSLVYFAIPNVGVGGQIEFERTSFADEDRTFYGIGPVLSYFIGNETSRILPHFAISFLWGKQTDSFSQTVVHLGAGGTYLLIPQVGISAEVFYQFENYSPENAGQSASGNSAGVTLGISAFVF